jgi:hypothetical protein
MEVQRTATIAPVRCTFVFFTLPLLQTLRRDAAIILKINPIQNFAIQNSRYRPIGPVSKSNKYRPDGPGRTPNLIHQGYRDLGPLGLLTQPQKDVAFK